MLYNILVGFVFSQLHYTTKKAASLFFSGCSLFFCFFTAPIIMFCQLLKQAAGNHAPCAQGFHLCHSYGQPSPEVSLLLYQFGILIARSFVTWLALAFQPDCFIHLCRLSPSKVLRLYYFTAGMCKLREIHNRKSSPRTDTVFCACSLNCQRAVSVRKRLEKACSLTNFIITLNFTYFKANFCQTPLILAIFLHI